MDLMALLRVDLFAGLEGFEETQGDVAMSGVLPNHQRYLLSKDGQVDGPVGKK